MKLVRAVTSLFTLATDLAQSRDPRLARGIAYGGLEAIVGAVPYVCLYFILLRVLGDGESTGLSTGWLLAIMFGSLALQIALGIRAMVSIMTASYALFGAARLRLADHVRRLPLGWIRGQRSGALTGVLTTELDLLAEIWSHFIAFFSGGVALPTVVGAFLLFVDWRLGLVMMAALPLAFLFLHLSLRGIAALTHGMLDALADANHAVSEYVQGIAVLRTFGRFGEGLSRFASAMEALRKSALRAEVAPAPLLGAFGFTVEAGFSVLVFTGAWMLMHGSIDATTFLLFVVVSVKFYGPLYDMGVSILLLRFAKQALQRTQALSEQAPMPERACSLHDPTSAAIELEDVTFGYDGAPAPTLHNVSASIPQHAMTAIVGPSGAGKSTLLHLIGRLWDVDEGRITLGSVDLRDLSGPDLNQRVAMVFQDVVLFSGSVRDNLRMGRADASDDEIEAAARAACAHEFIMALPQGYDTPVGDAGSRLSGGERQRLSIARALLKDADVILLDEATASVDPSAEAEIQRAIDALVRGKTVIVVAHRLRTIARATQILVLDEGRICESGTHASLLAQQGLYANLWRRQLTSGPSPTTAKPSRHA